MKISENQVIPLYTSSFIPQHQIKNYDKLNLFFTHQINDFDTITGQPVPPNYSNVLIL